MSKIKGISAERIARYILEKMGFKIIKTSERFKVDEVEIAEVDYIAESPEGEKYVVEVKAGDIDVSTIRNSYANAQILKMKPLIIGRGFSNEAAKKIAESLGVKVLQMSDFFILLDPTELEIIVRGIMTDVLNEYGFGPIYPAELDENELEFLITLSKSKDIQEFLNKTKMTNKDFGRFISTLKKKGILPEKSMKFSLLQRYIRTYLFWTDLHHSLKDLNEKLDKIIKLLERKKK